MANWSRRQQVLPFGSVSMIVRLAVVMVLVLTSVSQSARGQVENPVVSGVSEEPADPEVPEKVDVNPTASDEEIEERLTRILEATLWFDNARVDVDEGVVFLTGQTRDDVHREWAGNLARNTQDVVGVVNRIQLVQRSIWDLSPAWREVRALIRQSVQLGPLIGLALCLLLVTWLLAMLLSKLMSPVLQHRMENKLLRQVTRKLIPLPVFILGIYLSLRVVGLTQIAATVVGGTGLFGLIVGIAFRDIAENFLASLLVSLQRPFEAGDLIMVAGEQGFVQSVTTRGTLLMTLEGNHVHVPNSTIYKSVIHNYTTNPNVRLDFLLGVDYEDSASDAQQVLRNVLADHPAVLGDPEPLVLVEELGPSTVNLRCYFWIDGHQHSMLKVRSSVLRLTKKAVQDAGLTMPDESREILFPKGVPVTMVRSEDQTRDTSEPASYADDGADEKAEETSAVTSVGEHDLDAERDEIERQARQSRRPEAGTNLLEPE